MITVNDGIITKYYDKKDNFPALAEVGDYFIVTPNGTVDEPIKRVYQFFGEWKMVYSNNDALSGGDGVFEYCHALNNILTGFGVTSIPLDGTEFTEATLLYCVGENNGTNFWKHQINQTKMTCDNCTSVGVNHFSNGIEQLNCNIFAN